MKRDVDLIRELLLAIEEGKEDSMGLVRGIHGLESINSHLLIMNEAGLIEQYVDHLDHNWEIGRLTWEGHEFLDAARKTDLWNAAKDKVKRAIGGHVFELIQEVLLKLGRTNIGP